ncbi:hypothetical protein PENSPDRAFT_755499 [Peniophora sp. CONT]|nr:hypothetical protein PENSPDRAFT_755499 [Peniophora sp. CONT]
MSAPDEPKQSGDGVRDFGAPFNATNADIILRSSDRVDFRAHRTNLIVASPFFETMLALPTPAQGTSEDERKDGLAVIFMSEDARTIELLLSLSYPAHYPAMPANVDIIYPAIQLARKFEMPMAANFARFGLLALAEKEPERVYALGWLFQSKEVIGVAAKESLANPLVQRAGGPAYAEYAYVPATALHRLLAYQQRCLQRVSDVGAPANWLSRASLPRGLIDGEDAGQCYCSNTTTLKFMDGNVVRAKNWWLKYLQSAQVELQKSICISVVKGYKPLHALISYGVTDCEDCRALAVPALEELSNLLTDHVEAVTTEELSEMFRDIAFE